MNRTLRRSGVVVGLAAASTLAGIGTATADPSGELIPLTCDNGTSYVVAVAGNGEFTPGHDTASNTTIIPTGFGEAHGTVTDDQGNVLEEFTEPPSAKGNATKDRKTSVTCTFSVDGTETDPDLGVLHFHFEGSVIGFTTPAR